MSEGQATASNTPRKGGVFGKLAARRDRRTLRLENYLPALPPPPPAFDAIPRVQQGASFSSNRHPSIRRLFPMDGNDEYGCCCAEGTEVAAPNVLAAYRARYSGPVVTIITQFGRRLTVTPNHAILTPRGFVPARLLKEGDDVISGGFPQGFGAGGFDANFNQPPAVVEEVFAALDGIRAPIVGRGQFVSRAADFHGDGRFMDGNIDVVDTRRLLESESDAALGEPHGHEQVGSSRELESALAGAGAAFQGERARGLPAFRGVRGFGHGSALPRRQSGVPEGELLPLRPGRYAGLLETPQEVTAPYSELGAERVDAFTGTVADESGGEVHAGVPPVVFELPSLASDGAGLVGRSDCEASISHPSLESGPSDPELSGELLRRFPGLITVDRVMDVRHHDYNGHVYDLSTEQRWYSSNGIISHNCVVAAVAHAETCWNGWCGKRRIPGRQKVVSTYFALTGGVDSGLVEIDTLNVWRQRGLLGEKILAYAYVSPTNLDHVKSAISIFGSLFVGFVVQRNCIHDFNHGITWTPGPRTDGGHAVLITGYDAEGVTLLTWGASQKATWGWLQAMCDELYAILPGEATLAEFVPGFDLAALKNDLLLVQG